MHCSRSTIWGVLTTIGAFLFHLSLGYNYTIGNINPYLMHYMRITSGQTVWFHAVVISGQSIGMPLGGFLTSKIGFRPVVIIGALLTSGGMALSNLSISAGLGPFIATYAVMFGLGMGLPYSVLFTLAADWFPNHRAVVTGIILGGLGMGALVFTPIQTALINPDNKLPSDPSLRDRIPRAFLIIAGILLSFQAVAFCLLRKNHDTNEPDLFSEEEDTKRSTTETFDTKVPDESRFDDFDMDSNSIVLHNHQQTLDSYNYSIREALKTIDFYLVTMMVFINTVPITLQASSYKIFGNHHGLDDRFLSTIATCTSIFNCLGRVFWGLMCDLLSFKLPLCTFLLLYGLLFGTLPLIATSQAFQPLYAIWIFLLFFTMSGNFVLMPGTSFRIFGSKKTATIYGLIYLTTCPSALMLAGITSVHDIRANFDLVFYCCCGLCFLSLCIATFLKDKASRFKCLTAPCIRISDLCRYVPQQVTEEKIEIPNRVKEEAEDTL